MNSRLALATRYAWAFVGTPYKWGGDDPMAGFDCSGYCVEILQAVDLLPRHGDWSAAALWDKFKSLKQDPEEGCLVFWWNRDHNRIIHVEYCLDSICSLGASGGGSETVTVQDAIENNAFIKLRPFRSRPNIAGFLNPFSSL